MMKKSNIHDKIQDLQDLSELIDEVVYERDLAIKQLKLLGYELGDIPRISKEQLFVNDLIRLIALSNKYVDDDNDDSIPNEVLCRKLLKYGLIKVKDEEYVLEYTE